METPNIFNLENITNMPDFDNITTFVGNNRMFLLHPGHSIDVDTQVDRPLFLEFTCAVRLPSLDSDMETTKHIHKYDANTYVHLMNVHREMLNLTAMMGPDVHPDSYGVFWRSMYEDETRDERQISPGTLYIMRFFDHLTDKCRELMLLNNTSDTRMVNLNRNLINLKYLKHVQHPNYSTEMNGENPLDMCCMTIRVKRPEIPDSKGNVGLDKACKIYYMDRSTTPSTAEPITSYINGTFDHNGEELHYAGRHWVVNVKVMPIIYLGGSSPIINYHVMEMYLLEPIMNM